MGFLGAGNIDFTRANTPEGKRKIVDSVKTLQIKMIRDHKWRANNSNINSLTEFESG